jgi:oxygen-independent coproporphyrinogen-3 oxidase
LCTEIKAAAAAAGTRLPAGTVYFGGGTPSLLKPEQLEDVLATIDTVFDVQAGAEISLEANPGTLTLANLRDLHSLGINRLSLGVQSAHPGELRLLERNHTYEDVIRAVKWSRQAGFENLSLDLIFGLPEQVLITWQRSLDLALGLQPEHFSLYSLTLEHGTPFGTWARRGLLSEPDPDLAAEMYECASEQLEKHGYAQYEISNWARAQSHSSAFLPTANPPLACRLNLQYWRNLPYLGFGAGAHGYAQRVRTANVLAPNTYIQRLMGIAEPHPFPTTPLKDQGESSLLSPDREFPRTPATQNYQIIDRKNENGETMMMGLRLTREGVSKRGFFERFGLDLDDLFKAQIDRLTHLGLLEWAGERADILRLTPRGRLLGNQVFVEFI